MASPFQQASTRRKLIYIAIIAGLLSLNVFGPFIAQPIGGAARAMIPSPAGEVIARVFEPPTVQADRLEMSERARGETDVTKESVQLILTGSRGLAVCALWVMAIEKQKKHEWDQMELLVRSILSLQPYFYTPWLFQSWNLAYNVSVESDRVNDKYFYISRGIELLAEGERINRGQSYVDPQSGELIDRGNPDFRFWTGFYYLNKFGVSDEATTLRTLFQMSCMPSSERDPSRFRRPNPDGTYFIDREAFKDFVTKHPQLVRRLREAPTYNRFVNRYDTPEAIVEFLEENRKLPTRYGDPLVDGGRFPADQLRKRNNIPVEQFPVLPPAFAMPQYEWPIGSLHADMEVDDTFENYQAGRAWNTFAQRPLPPPPFKPSASPLNYDRSKYRLPRSPMAVIFRQYPARSQTYTAERLQKEGWFDADGWEVDEGRPDSATPNRWFRGRVVVGSGRNWAVDAWTEAYKLWDYHGRSNGLRLDPRTIDELQQGRARIVAKYGESAQIEQIAPEDMDDYKFIEVFRFYTSNRSVTNFDHFFYLSAAELRPETIAARKLFFQAERLRKAAEPERAIPRFEEAFKRWKELLVRKEFAEFRTDHLVQEDIYERQLNYLDQVQTYRGASLSAAQTVADLTAQVSAPQLLSLEVGMLRLLPEFFPEKFRELRQLPVSVIGPVDGVDPSGTPWIPSDVASRVRNRLGGKPQPFAPPANEGTK